MLAKFAMSRPEILADLVDDAGPDQLPTLVAALRESPDVIAKMRKLTDEALTTTPAKDLWSQGFKVDQWWGTEPNDQDAAFEAFSKDQPLQELLIECAALTSPSNVLVQRLSKPKFDSLNSLLEKHNYRVFTIDTYDEASHGQQMAVWIRDGRKSRYVTDATAEELRKLNEANRREGYFPCDVTAHSNDGYQSHRYNCVWSEGLPAMVLDADMYVEVPESRHEADGWSRFVSGNFAQRCNLITHSNVGEAHYTSIRWKLKERIATTDKWGMQREDLKAALKLNENIPILHAKLDSRQPSADERGFEVVWWNGAPFRSHWVDYLSLEDHRRECKRLMEAGFRPISVDASRVGADATPLYSSTWWLPLPNQDAESELSQKHSRRITALYMLGDIEKLKSSLSQVDSPELRANLIDTFSRHNLPQSWVVEQLENVANPLTLRLACASKLLALYAENRLPPTESQRFNEFVAQSSKAIVDPGLRSAVEAICSRWGMEVPSWQDSKDELRTKSGQRMIVLRPDGPFLRGSFANEPGRDRNKEIAASSATPTFIRTFGPRGHD